MRVPAPGLEQQLLNLLANRGKDGHKVLVSKIMQLKCENRGTTVDARL